MGTATVRRVTCDGCPKVVESSGAGDKMPEERALPDGWITVSVTGNDVFKQGDFHSRACAAAWLTKRDYSGRVRKSKKAEASA